MLAFVMIKKLLLFTFFLTFFLYSNRNSSFLIQVHDFCEYYCSLILNHQYSRDTNSPKIKPITIVHAVGGYNNEKYTNSLESLNNNCGFIGRYFKLDNIISTLYPSDYKVCMIAYFAEKIPLYAVAEVTE